MSNLSERPRPVTVFDLLILLSMVAVLLAVAIPGYRRADVMEDANRVKRELEAVERAVALAAEKHGIAPGESVDFDRYGAFIEKPQRLAEEGEDVLGHPFGTQVVGEKPRVPAATVEHFSKVVDEGFWKPYLVE